MLKQSRRMLANLLLASIAPITSQALEITIQDTTLSLTEPGALCIKIEGEYRGVRVEPSEAGKTPKVCYDTIRKNLLTLTDSTFISTDPEGGEVEIEFHHSFPPGPNGLVIAHVLLDGLFATAGGVGVPTGSHIELHGSMLQGFSDNRMGDGVSYTVEEDLESGVFVLEARDQYLIAAERTLRAVLSFHFVSLGDKLVLPESAAVGLEGVPRIQEKFQDAEEGLDF